MPEGPEPPRPAWARGESIYQPLRESFTLPRVTREWAWAGATGAGVRVAIVDSGIDASHPALEGCVDEAAGVALSLDDGEIVAERGPHQDLFGHGTACAAIVHSIAPEARIVSVRVLNARLAGRGQVFLRGLAWAIEHGFDVINLSLGTPKRDWALPFYEMCDQAYFRGALVVTAANNNPVVSFPSLFGSVTSVACNLATDPMEFHVNPDPPTEFLARGIDVELAWLGGGTVRATGNSFAAPHIAGIAALIRSKHPAIRPFQLKSVLAATAANLPEEELIAAAGMSGVFRRPGLSGVHQPPIASGRALSAVHSVLR